MLPIKTDRSELEYLQFKLERLQLSIERLLAFGFSKSELVKAVGNEPWALYHKHQKHYLPNLEVLREQSIPRETVGLLFTEHAGLLWKDSEFIAETIGKLKEWDMDVSSMDFVTGMKFMIMWKKESVERKVELYKSFGCSVEDIFAAIAREPMILLYSYDEIKRKMELFTEKLKWDSKTVLRYPIVLTLGLEKRVIPRCSALSVLAKNRLWNGEPSLYSLLCMSEQNFGDMFVYDNRKEAPQVVAAYEGKMDFVGFESSYE